LKEEKGEYMCGSDGSLSNASPWIWLRGTGIGSAANPSLIFHLTAMAMKKGDWGKLTTDLDPVA
jgi:hypothetical protein